MMMVEATHNGKSNGMVCQKVVVETRQVRLEIETQVSVVFDKHDMKCNIYPFSMQMEKMT